ncbi:hypothetical protein MKW98_019616 [Papaver atlanticum]|uniref:Uncharacterized protein n=1 Tax=Papaver atlanticum TaxID=357466 RepID=A0AAD4S8N3_9MAGN|nr:hypothetical protein MKW98_019616 [Papaver atlanticum]
MAVSAINCSFNVSSSPPSQSSSKSSSTTTPTNLVPWQRKETGSWSRQCMVGMMACVIINGSDIMMPLISNGADSYTSGAGDHHQTAKLLVQSEQQREVMTTKWSDKIRACPPWHINSIETIVPENLPRPSAHRKSESVSRGTTTSFTFRRVIRTVNDCFSM